jgi:hypothetical protein
MGLYPEIAGTLEDFSCNKKVDLVSVLGGRLFSVFSPDSRDLCINVAHPSA